MPSYTLDELIKAMEPQAQRDKVLIGECIAGLALYAAQQAHANHNSSKIEEMRTLVENLVGYWGLDDGDHAPPLEDFLSAFDEQVHAAKLGAEITGDTYRRHTDTIYGLHRYGEDMIVSQGDSAMSEILDMSDLMKEIAGYWDFEPYAVVDDLAAQLRAEVRSMLEAIPLPGQPAIGENVRYEIKQAILFGNDRGFALAQNPNAPAPFVTWQFTDEGGKRDFYWGKYYATEDRARLSYLSRVTDYMESYKVTEKPNPLAAAEMSAEQNYNMIDGIPNNEAPARADLTDGQTYEEIRELAPETLPGDIPVQVLSEVQPTVTVTFSEHDQLRGIEKMPLYLADTLFAELDEKHLEDRRQPGYEGAPYLKTDYRIDFIMDGKPDSYSGRYDVGDDDGSLLDRIHNYNEYNRRDEDYQQYLADKGGSEQEVENARLDIIVNKLVPFFETHCELSEKEAAALSELMGIHEAAAGRPSEADQPRIAYLEAVVDYAGRSRTVLNTTGLDSLPEAPHPVAAGVKEKSGRDEKPSVLKQIKAARNAPKPPSKPKETREKKSPELDR